MPGIRFALIASLALLATACHAPEPPPTDEPPEPQAIASRSSVPLGVVDAVASGSGGSSVGGGSGAWQAVAIRASEAIMAKRIPGMATILM